MILYVYVFDTCYISYINHSCSTYEPQFTFNEAHHDVFLTYFWRLSDVFLRSLPCGHSPLWPDAQSRRVRRPGSWLAVLTTGSHKKPIRNRSETDETSRNRSGSHQNTIKYDLKTLNVVVKMNLRWFEYALVSHGFTIGHTNITVSQQQLGIGDDFSRGRHVTLHDFIDPSLDPSLDHHLTSWCCCCCWPGAQFTVWAPPGCPCITCRRCARHCARHNPRLSERLSERLTKGSVMLCCCVELIWNPTFAEANSVQCRHVPG